MPLGHLPRIQDYPADTCGLASLILHQIRILYVLVISYTHVRLPAFQIFFGLNTLIYKMSYDLDLELLRAYPRSLKHRPKKICKYELQKS